MKYDAVVIIVSIAHQIEVVHHDAPGLLEPLVGQVSATMQPVQPGAVTEMESRHRVQG